MPPSRCSIYSRRTESTVYSNMGEFRAVRRTWSIHIQFYYLLEPNHPTHTSTTLYNLLLCPYRWLFFYCPTRHHNLLFFSTPLRISSHPNRFPRQSIPWANKVLRCVAVSVSFQDWDRPARISNFSPDSITRRSSSIQYSAGNSS